LQISLGAGDGYIDFMIEYIVICAVSAALFFWKLPEVLDAIDRGMRGR